MASAGRILIIPKGDWSAETEYEMLDLVKHNGKSWLAKKNAVGIEPIEENSEYWQDMFDISAETIGALSKNGGYLEGELYFQEHDNGYGRIRKNHTNEIDMGLDIFDFDSKGDKVRLCIQANADNDDKIGIFISGGDKKRLFGEHNLDLLNQYIDARIAEKMK